MDGERRKEVLKNRTLGEVEEVGANVGQTKGITVNDIESMFATLLQSI